MLTSNLTYAIILQEVIFMAKNELWMSCCPKCGDVNDDLDICPFCGTKPIRTKYTFEELLLGNTITDEQIVDEYARSSPQFDEELYAQREGKEKILQQASLDKQMSANKVTCPYCKSTNTKKITNTSKAVHTALFGIFSISRNSKQWHCNNCKSDF